MKKFTALMVDRIDGETITQWQQLEEQNLPPGNVLVRVRFSSLNYKDSLAITGKGAIIKSFPMVPGIDLAGVVEKSESMDFHVGDEVLVTGQGLSETHWGGLSQFARVPAEWLMHRPALFTLRQCMAIGTAGFTAMQCAMALKKHGVKPNRGEIVVTGAAGGVGSLAVALLSSMGYSVVASTGRSQEEKYLRSMGAVAVMDRAVLATPGKPLSKATWAGAVDTAGGHTLANVCAGIKINGAVAACGLAESMDFPASVAPFILRGIALYGINSVYVTAEERLAIWQNLQRYLNPALLESMTSEIPLSEVLAFAPRYLSGVVRGRVVVNIPQDGAP